MIFTLKTVVCSIGYKMSDYPQLSSINSQIVEQSNSALKRVKSMLSYMNVTNFMKHCKFYVWYQNYKKKYYCIRT